MTLDTESIYFGVPPEFNILTGPFVIVSTVLHHGCIEIKLLDKKHKNFRSGNTRVTTLGHASVSVRCVERSSKISNINDLIKAVIFHD